MYTVQCRLYRSQNTHSCCRENVVREITVTNSIQKKYVHDIYAVLLRRGAPSHCEPTEKLDVTWAIFLCILCDVSSPSFRLLWVSNRSRHVINFLWRWICAVDQIDHFLNVLVNQCLCCWTWIETLPPKNEVTSKYYFPTITIIMMIFMIIYYTWNRFPVILLISYRCCTCWIGKFALIYKL